ncbi:heparan-alpha-glucosaminide N-acetyltransferase [Thermomicrobium sp. 4228-Ro]|uniref:heparan-alpha-glucosaminide N-acetyltransferase n=1 Tax=Thermomicrobium sp. 4228-Ro TaxID=2993937 RepID=UPI0022499CC8|nr:heparan-alpha-glucosaminide N-acetyltransferase [Thermomicrobium sp. 4228-Ro]MCX2727636.1 heparan-alpha-glucosaminide N-acetyltransferase [Thermomicrobium sp. 4228-Ro]
MKLASYPSTQVAGNRTAGGAVRFWEIDALRGVAFLLMVVYHAAFDLAAFGGWPIAVTVGGWRLFADFIASLFLFVSGVSLVLAHDRLGRDRERYRRHLLRRFSRLAGAALLVTIVTWFLSPADVVLFGILHLILVSNLLSLALLRLREWNVLVAGGALLLGSWFASLPGNRWLFWLGLVPEGYRSFDFRPLFPWMAVVLLGVALASWFYAGGVRRWPFPEAPTLPGSRVLIWLGRHSLLLYLVHQPILIACLTAIGAIDFRRLIG